MTRYTRSDVTVILDGGLEDLVRRALDAVEGGEVVRRLEAEAEAVAEEARGFWYRQVDKETGLSGDIQVVTTVSDTEVRVGIGSTDRRTAGKTGKPLPVMVHRPTARSLKRVEVTRADYFKAPERLRHFEDGKFYLDSPNPLASDGKYLLQELVRKPAKVKLQALAPELARLLAQKMGRS